MAPPSKIVIGCLIGVLSSATQSIGLTLQRKSHIIEDSHPLEFHKPPYKRPLWRLGFLLFLIANLLGSSIQITTLPLIILSPLQAIGLVFNSICSALILHEPFSKFSIIGTVLVGIGALFIAAFGSIEEPNHSLKELLELMGRQQFLVWIVLSNLIVVIILIWIHFVKFTHLHKSQFINESVGSEGVNIQESSSRFKIPNAIRRFSVDLSLEKFKFLKGCLYGIVSGILSAHSLLLAKSAVEIILNSLLKSNLENFKNFKSWIIIATFFTLAITQLVFLNKGLRNVSTSVLYPLVFCIYNITNIINGLIFYNQLHILSVFQIFMIVLGTLLVLIGVFALSWRLNDNCDKSYESTPFKNSLHERSGLLSPNLEFDDEDDQAGYISFGSPKAGEQSEVSFEFDENNDNGTDDNESSRKTPTSPIKPFKYGTFLDNGNTPLQNKRRSKRVLSYEQNELLYQLNNLSNN